MEALSDWDGDHPVRLSDEREACVGKRTMSINDYLIDQAGTDWNAILSSWKWLLPEEFTLWLVNRFGDLFFVLEDGTVHMLDVGAGTIEQVSESRDDFSLRIDANGIASNWLLIPLVDELVASGKILKHRECYSYVLAPVFGGDYTVDNTIISSLQRHYSSLGRIHEEIRDLPDGTPISRP